jgi:hypothetical protein
MMMILQSLKGSGRDPVMPFPMRRMTLGWVMRQIAIIAFALAYIMWAAPKGALVDALLSLLLLAVGASAVQDLARGYRRLTMCPGWLPPHRLE